jgi:hypothetical protein
MAVIGHCGSGERRALGAPLRRTQPQAGPAQTAHQLATVDLQSPRRHHPIAMLLWHVVVVALETPAWHPNRIGEVVQLRQRPVRYQMAPAAAAPPPARLVDEHHGAQPGTAGGGAVDRARRLVAPRPPPGDTEPQ